VVATVVVIYSVSVVSVETYITGSIDVFLLWIVSN
jgi:hypothetical protein